MDVEDFFIDTIVRVMVLIVIVGIIFCCFGILGDRSQGERIGIPVKLSQKGWVFKTWEGEVMVRGLIEEERGTLPYRWEVSICDKDPEKIRKFKDSMRRQEPVLIEYRSPLIGWIWNQKTMYCMAGILNIKSPE